MKPLAPCPCGTARKPTRVRSNRADHVRLRCTVCGRRGFSGPVNTVEENWNVAMGYERVMAENNRLPSKKWEKLDDESSR